MKIPRLGNVFLICLVITSLGQAEDSQPATTKISFSRQIAPIFRVRCQGCHQPAKAQGAYVMTNFDGLLTSGESGSPAIVPGKPDESYLVEQVTSVDGEAAMPAKGQPLSAAEVQLIRRWIAEGAVDDSPPSTPKYTVEHPPQYSRPPVITAAEYSPDGKWLATSGFQEVLLINTDTWKTEKRLVGLSERIESLSFSHDSRRLAVTGGSPGRFGEVQVWDVESGQLQLSHQVTYDTIYGGSFSPDGKLIAFGCADNTVRAIDSETGQQKLHQGAHEDWIRSVVFNPEGTHVVSAGRDMTAKLTEVATERFIDNITSITPGALRGGINSLAMHPQRDEVLVGGADGIPKVYRLFRVTERRIGDDANLIRKFPETGGRIFSVDISRDGNLIAVASTLDGHSSVQVYPYDFTGELPDDVKKAMAKRAADRNAEEKKRIAEFTGKTSKAVASVDLDDSSLYALAFSADAQQVTVGGSDGRVRTIEIASSAVVHEFSPVEVSVGGELASHDPSALLAGTGMPLDTARLPSTDQETQLLPQSRPIELRIEPARIELNSAADYAQLVVSAVYSEGAVYDVTRLCTISTGQGAVQVSELGLVRPLHEGEAALQVNFAGQSQSIPVHVGTWEHAPPVDFVRDVNPILSRLGCNSGTCHGAQKGKQGFKLSLRGYDPVEDIRALSDDLSSRRLNSAAPDASLMLLKPTGAVPHEGGVLLSRDSVHYATLREWIAGGAKLDRASQKVLGIEVFPKKPVIESENSWQQFRVVASYADGSRRDVTHEAFIESGNSEVCKSYSGGRVQALRRGEAPILARYEGAYAATTVTVMGDRQGFQWKTPQVYNTIDRLVAAKWARMKIQPSDVCADHEFLRRVRLDLTGLPPSPEELKSFLADPRPSKLKRQAKIDELIGSEDYVDHWTNKWADLLQVNSKFLGKEGAKAFREWIRTAIAQNQPYDVFARQVLTASGSNKQNSAASYYKILREPDLIMENTTHLFLAIRFNCNKCHDHPFERWTQDQYYQLSAFFAQTALKEDPASRGKKIGGTAVEGAKPLYEEVYDKTEGEMQHARTGATVSPQFPFECDFEVTENATRREQLAAWLTSKDNPYFAKSFVNRMWGYLTGTGLMEPLDDIRAGNPPTNPELLAHLTDEFVASRFDVEHLMRLICNSRTYQLSVASNDWNRDDGINYSHAKARRLPAEVLYDAVYRVTGAVSQIPGMEPGTRAAALPDVAVQLPDGFLNNLGRPVRESACECERSQDLQLGPVMALVSGPTIGNAISDPKCALPQLAETELTEEELIREVYLRVLSREATDEEVQSVLESADQIDVDHTSLQKQLTERELWWKSEKERRETQRLADLKLAQAAVKAREEEIAEDRQRREEERLAKLAQAQQALEQYAASAQELAQTYLSKRKQQPHWFPLAPFSLKTSNKIQLVAQEDRSIVASGKADKGTYTITYRTPLTGIRGFRLEALPLADIEGGGPGLAKNGNFVVTEIELDAAPLAKPKQKQRVALSGGKADFSQVGFSPEKTYDGRTRDAGGWAVSPRGGVVHWATFQTAKPIEHEGGSVLTFTIHQFHNAQYHRLARFRISVTTDAGDVPLGLPEEFSALQSTPQGSRNEEHLAGLIQYLAQSDAKWQERKQAVAGAKKPLPPDGPLVELQRRAKNLETETPDDLRLVQLRSDFAASQKQVQNRRLTLAQDLTWALINSPAFLFNH